MNNISIYSNFSLKHIEAKNCLGYSLNEFLEQDNLD